ncbi:hypothetical protein COHA_003156 [Chlorella ohadii]|uniref:Uncharacterized protein n=1 Tax=Chlorella ohadii TaxID=2649997 RepID=A0AAD5H852_9CHLO|nr:hypothetical protein COHA_003156 [Chlorella ohadii]
MASVQQKPSMVQRTRTVVMDVYNDTACLLFTLSFLISVGASIVVLGGLAAMTAFCWDNQPLGLGAGFKMTPSYAAKTMEVMRIEKAAVTSTEGSFQCDKFFRFDWFLWTFQVVWLMIVGLCWYRRTLRKYQSALWAMGATVTAWHFFKINYIISMDQWTMGELHTQGIITAGGLIFCCIGNFFMFLSGANYALTMPRRNELSGVAFPGMNGNSADGKSFNQPDSPHVPSDMA